MKHFDFFYLSLVLMSMLSSKVFAYDFSAINDGTTIYYNYVDGGVCVTYKDENYNAYSGEVRIPSEVSNSEQEYNVVSIGDDAFQSCSDLTSVEIPSGLLTIGAYAFGNCSGLTSIEIPNSVTSIGEYAFWGCTGLTSVRIPAGVTSIGLAAFSAALITSITVERSEPFNLTQSICDSQSTILYVPYGTRDAYIAAGWTTDYFHGGIVEMPAPAAIGDQFTAAVPCGDGTADLTFTVTNLKPLEVEVSQGDAIIEGELIIPATVTYNGADFAVTAVKWEGFTKWNSNPYSVVLPEGLTTIWDRGFSSSNVTAVTLPSTLTDIYQGAFMNCVSLSDITLPDGLTKIALATFQNTPALKSINIPASVKSIEHSAFHLSGLEQLYVPNTVRFVESNGTWPWWIFATCTSLREVVFEAFEDGQEPWGVTSMFNGCTALESIVLPSNSVIQRHFFSGCKKLRSVTYLKIDDGFDARKDNFNKMYAGLNPYQIQFTVPEGKAELLLKAGYMNLSDLSGLPIVKAEFEGEAARIEAMAESFETGGKENFASALNAARTAVTEAGDYAAVYAQMAVIRKAAQTFLATATITKGADITAAYVTNPNFDNLSLGWGGYIDWTAWPPHYFQQGWNEQAYENGDISISKFYDAINTREDEGYNTLGDGTLSQTIADLPAGIYRLEADIIAANQNDAEVTGVSLFAGNATTAVATEDGKPQHFSVKFEKNIDGDVTIGLNTNNTNANWVAIDNVRLYYEGAVAAAPAGTELVSSEEDTYYIYNVETGMYLNGGNGWGTQAVLAETGLPVRMTQDGDGYWQVYFREGSRFQQLLFSDQDGNVLTDYNGSGNCLWNITATDGSYAIQSVADLGTDFVLGNDPLRQDIDLRSNVTLDTHIDVIRTDNTANNTRWQFIKKADYDLMMAKRYLLSTIFRMGQSGVENEDLLNTAQAVYDDETATIDAVVAATTLLNSQMGMPQQNQPLDMTALIVNPRFENNTTEGWTGAELTSTGNAQNTQHQTHEFFNTSFNIFQTITGVPNGLYRLKWKGFHRPGNWWQVCADFEAGTDNASAVVYANGVQKTMKHICTGMSDTRQDDSDREYQGRFLPDQQWGVRAYFDKNIYADMLEVEVTDNVLTIGVKNTQDMSGEHWVIFSDFELEILQNAETFGNQLAISDISSVPGGSATLPIKLDNTDQIVSFSAEVRLPEGVVPKTDGSGNIIVKKSSRISMTVDGTVTPDGTCHFAALTNGQAISGNNGEIFSFVILPAGNMELGDYEVRLENVKLINDQLLRIQPFDAVSTLTLKKAATGDVNGDGDVDILDATMIVYYVLGRNPSLNLEAGDVNGDGDVDILDATIIVYRVLGKNVNAAKSRQLTLPDPQ